MQPFNPRHIYSFYENNLPEKYFQSKCIRNCIVSYRIPVINLKIVKLKSSKIPFYLECLQCVLKEKKYNLKEYIL